MANKSFTAAQVNQAKEHRLYKIFYQQHLGLAKKIEGSIDVSPEQWAENETVEKVLSLAGVAKREANERVVNVATGRVIGKRKNIEKRFA